MEEPDWYCGWQHDAVHGLQAKNKQLEDEFGLGRWGRYDYDVDTRTLLFSQHGSPKVIAQIQIAGTASVAAGNWLWAWANPHWPPDIVQGSLAARAFGDEHGICDLTHDYVSGDDLNSLGWGLTSAAVRITGARGAYRPPLDDGGGLFLMINTISWVI